MLDTVVGKLITDGKIEFRVYYCNNFTARAIICKIDGKPTTKFELQSFNVTDLLNRINNGELSIVEEETPTVIDETLFDEKAKNLFEKNKQFIRDVSAVYGPEYFCLLSSRKKEWEELLEKHKMSRDVAWKMVRRYLQSGLCISSIVDKRKLPKPKESRVGLLKNNPGVKTKHSYVLKPEDIKYMDEQTARFIADKINNLVYHYCELLNTYYVNPDGTHKDAYPSIRQFRLYIQNNVSSKDLAKRKLDAADDRNNYRLTLESARLEASRPGQYIEVDECELCVNIVSSVDRRQIIGKPILYLAVDLYSHAIVGLSILLYNNSFCGISSLLLNIFEGSEKYFARYGVVKGAEYIPSCFCPEVIKSDQGSEYTSYNFEDLCLELGTMHNLMPVKLGSYKGTVERKFGFIQEFLRPALKHHGLITSAYDSDHKETACYTLEAITQMCMNIAIYHNSNPIDKLRLSREMSLATSKKPIDIWNYGVTHFGAPIPVTSANKNEYFYKCLVKVNALAAKTGINIKGLTYYENTPEINEAMYNASYKGKTKEITVGIDLRDAGHIYYNNNGQIIPIPLVAGQIGNEYDNVTWSEYLGEHEVISARDKEDKRVKTINKAITYRNNETILANQKVSEFKPKKTGITEARTEEKNLTAGPERVLERMGFAAPQIEDTKEDNELSPPEETPSSPENETVELETPVTTEPVSVPTVDEKEEDISKLSLAQLSKRARKDTLVKSMKENKYIKHD